jgi:chromosome segregation ATPase
VLQFTDKIAALVAELEHSKAQLEAAEERDFQKGITLMKLEEALAKSNADMASSTGMHARDMTAASESLSRAQDNISLLQEQLDIACARIESLSSELAAASEAQQLSATQVQSLLRPLCARLTDCGRRLPFWRRT